ncbi:MAG TPA: hypothetical protein VMR66_01185 [Gemmatimonadota bacterium]|nr:hypothetical protein [Gemmatimonadota bacterium]
MVIAPGQEGVVLSITSISIHGAEYVDVVLGDPDAPDDPNGRLSARLGPESIAGEVQRGDRVRIEGFLSLVTGIEKVG